MARLTGEKELLLTPAGWTEDYHGSGIEPSNSDEYILREHRAYLNWTIWGGKRFQLFALSPRIIQDIRDYKPDIILVDSEPFGLLAFEVALIRWWFFPSALLVVHSSQNLYKRYPFPFNATEAFVMHQATVLFARSGEARQVLLRKACQRPIYVIPHGVDAAHYSPAVEKATRGQADGVPLRIGYVGSLAEQKGVHILIKAVSGLDRPFELTIVGNGPERPALETQAARSPAAPQIRFRNSVPNKRLPDTLRTFDVLVLPSVTMPNWKEQFGRIIIEAMACGVPVVGSTCGSIPEVIADGGLVFAEGSAAELRAVLEQMADDRALLHELSSRARCRALEHFSWESVTRRILAIYRERMEYGTE